MLENQATIGVLWLILGSVCLYFGAEILIKNSAQLADRFGISHFIIGLTVVAFGTSAPELAVSLRSHLGSYSAIALGNVVGSNICNVLLILAVAALLSPFVMNSSCAKRDLPIMALVSLTFFFFVKTSNVVSRMEAASLFIALIIYIIYIFMRKPEDFIESSSEVDEMLEEEKTQRGAPLLLLFAAIGAGVLVFGANFMVSGAHKIAVFFEISDAIVALSMVALGTSLPELAATVASAKHGHSDIAVGNVVGSNMFNIMSIIGICGLFKAIPSAELRQSDLLIMLASSILLLPIAFVLLAKSAKFPRWLACIFLISYGVYIWHLFAGA